MLRGIAALCCILAVSACEKLQDPVSASILMSPKRAIVDVRRSLPASGDEALRALAEWGYLPDRELEIRANKENTSTEDGHSSPEILFLPDIASPTGAHERKYLMRRMEIDYGGEGYGVVLDVDQSGEVLTAVGFGSYQLIF